MALNREKIPRMTDAELDLHRLPSRQVFQALAELE